MNIKDIKDIIDDYFSKEDQEPLFFRNGPLNLQAIAHLRKVGAVASVTHGENGQLITEYFFPDAKETP